MQRFEAGFAKIQWIMWSLWDYIDFSFKAILYFTGMILLWHLDTRAFLSPLLTVFPSRRLSLLSQTSNPKVMELIMKCDVAKCNFLFLFEKGIGVASLRQSVSHW